VYNLFSFTVSVDNFGLDSFQSSLSLSIVSLHAMDNNYLE